MASCKFFFIIAVLMIGAITEARLINRLRRTAERNELDDKTPKTERIICAPQTPCGWKVYQQYTGEEQVYVDNTSYCKCSEGTHCIRTIDDPKVGASIYHCRSEKKS